MKVHCTYFNQFGKYYTQGTYTTFREEIHEIFDEVRQMLNNGLLPGLRRGTTNFHVLVEVPDHPNAHPCLIVPPSWE